jgi:hypothetical protein
LTRFSLIFTTPAIRNSGVAMQTFQIRHNVAGTGDREVPHSGGDFRFVRVVRGWFPGDCHVLRDDEDVNTPNGLVAFIKELGLADDLRNEVLATLKNDGRVRINTRRKGEVRLSRLGF